MAPLDLWFTPFFLPGSSEHPRRAERSRRTLTSSRRTAVVTSMQRTTLALGCGRTAGNNVWQRPLIHHKRNNIGFTSSLRQYIVKIIFNETVQHV